MLPIRPLGLNFFENEIADGGEPLDPQGLHDLAMH